MSFGRIFASFFLSSDITDNKFGKLLVIALSLFLLNRLLIFSILGYYLVKYGKKYFYRLFGKLNAIGMVLGCFLFISLFSLWYSSRSRSEISYETGFRRIVRLNDGSNEIRFKANELVLKDMFDTASGSKRIFGYGPFENFQNAKKIAFQPHNELFNSAIEFGWLSVIFFALFTLPFFNRLVSFDNLEYFVPILFCTLLLWVKYLLVPSPEMQFILFLLSMASTHNDTAPSRVAIESFS